MINLVSVLILKLINGIAMTGAGLTNVITESKV